MILYSSHQRLSIMIGYLLSHDVGTTGDKALLVGIDGKLIGTASCSYPTSYPRPGWAEHDPENWWRAVVKTTREIIDSKRILPKDIIAIGITGLSASCLPPDQKCHPLGNALIHMDTRSYGQVEQIRKKVGEDTHYKITGRLLNPSITAISRILWLKENQPTIFERRTSLCRRRITLY